MLLIYTEKKSPRLMYICEHIFVNMLGLSIEITTDLETFVKSDESKLSYAKSPIGNEFFIKNFGLLFQKNSWWITGRAFPIFLLPKKEIFLLTSSLRLFFY